MKNIIIIYLLFVSSVLYSQDSVITNNKTNELVYIFDMKQMVGPALWRQTKQAFTEADKNNADLFLIHMNTYGGILDAADSIRTKILNSKIPVYVFIDNNAASAGALISIACDRIYMRKGANIGAATVVNQSGKKMPDKYQSYMRSMMRATAESHGKDTIINGNDTILKWKRDPLIAEAMVDPRTYIKSIIDTGKVITFTTTEAIKFGYCEGQAENIKEVLEKAGIKNYKTKKYQLTSLEKLIGLLVSPYISGLLIMIIIGGIYFELQTPGIGFPLAAAVIAALVYFAPLYLEGLAANWEILIFIIGLVLIALEIFVIPGFGIAGISGIILSITGLTLSMVDNFQFNFDNTIALEAIFRSFLIVITAMVTAVVASIYFSKKLLTQTPLRSFVLNTSENRSEGFVGVDKSFENLVGKTGITTTILRQAGKISIDNEIYDAIAEIGYINKGEKIKVIKYEAAQLHVIKL